MKIMAKDFDGAFRLCHTPLKSETPFFQCRIAGLCRYMRVSKTTYTKQNTPFKSRDE